MDPEITNIYGNKVRLRVCGLCWRGEDLLLVNHSGLTSSDFWAPPGGGVEFAQTLAENLEREFMEETGLRVRPERFLFGCEYLRGPLHSVELFFSVSILDGVLRQGSDPELQIIKEVRFFSPGEIRELKADDLHGIFTRGSTPREFEKLSGFYRI